MRAALPLRVSLLHAAISSGGCVDPTFREGLACGGGDRSCPPGQRCYGMGAQASCHSSPPDAPPSCDPLDPRCPPGQACYWHAMAQGGPACQAAGTSGAHMQCTGDSQCAASFSCGETILGRECVQYCRLGGVPCFGLDMCMPLEGSLGQCKLGGGDPVSQNCGAGICNMNPGTIAEGLACTPGPPTCAKGLHCLGCGDGAGRCGRYCDARVVVDGNVGACSTCP